jgi:hypothetical protein
VRNFTGFGDGDERRASMDDRQFDNWARTVAGLGSRRRVLGGLAGVAGATLLGAFRRSASDVAAHHGSSGPGDPCRHDDQCLGADAPLVCAWNGFGYDGDLNCCTYEGNRCGSDEACCGLASCVGGICSSAGFASAGSGGVATADAQGGTVSIGDVNSGGNAGNAISVGNTQGGVRVDGGNVSNVTDISASADGGMAIADASGGSGNVAGDGGGSGGNWFPPDYAAGPGDPCQYTGQCTNSQSFLTCDYNAYTDDYRCCGYQGDRCDWDGGCCGWLSCNDNGYCTS